eukprot:Skav229736  [mRNA]  locus=scaffold1287:146090:150782:+ [translate_table: standard]
MGRQGLRKKAVQMATEELENFRSKNQKRAEALMLLTLAEIKLNNAEKDAREEACHFANQAKTAFSNLKDRKMEGESCLANGNALLKSAHSGTSVDAAAEAITVFGWAVDDCRWKVVLCMALLVAALQVVPSLEQCKKPKELPS